VLCRLKLDWKCAVCWRFARWEGNLRCCFHGELLNLNGNEADHLIIGGISFERQVNYGDDMAVDES
jgi:hypothetical protein